METFFRDISVFSKVHHTSKVLLKLKSPGEVFEVLLIHLPKTKT